MRYMKGNKSTAQPSNLVFFDCETRSQSDGTPLGYGLHKLWFGCASALRLEKGEVTRHAKCTFHTCEDFWTFLESRSRPKSCTWVFAHNMGFDATIIQLWERIRDGKLRIIIPKTYGSKAQQARQSKKAKSPLIILDDPPTVIQVEDNGGRQYKFIDTLNYWRTSLATLGKGIGVDKLDMPDYPASPEAWQAYCERDVEVIEKSVVGLLRWIKAEDLGKFRLTSPSQAMAAFRHRFRQHKILYHDNEQARKIERESYYGGQVECYLVGSREGNIHQLDVTSLYPSIMKGELYPWRLASYTSYQQHQQAIPFTRGMDKVATVIVDTLERTYPRKMKDGVYHCSGTFVTSLAGPELDYALTHNHIKQVYDYATYNITYLFDDYVNYFWRKRKEYKEQDNPLGDILCKLLLNSLYGKFGQKDTKWEYVEKHNFVEEFGQFSKHNEVDGKKTTYRVLGGICHKQVSEGEIDTAFPGIAAYVTSYGREKMHKLRNVAGQSHVFYQAVDALYVDDTGLARLEAAGEVGKKELGKLSLEGSFSTAEFRGMNNYTIGEKVVRGSVKKSAKQLADDWWEEPQFQHLASILAAPLQGGVEISPNFKFMRNEYNRREIHPSQLTSPIYLDEDVTPCQMSAKELETLESTSQQAPPS